MVGVQALSKRADVFYEGGVVVFHAFAVNGAFLRVVGSLYVL